MTQEFIIFIHISEWLYLHYLCDEVFPANSSITWNIFLESSLVNWKDKIFWEIYELLVSEKVSLLLHLTDQLFVILYWVWLVLKVLYFLLRIKTNLGQEYSNNFIASVL